MRNAQLTCLLLAFSSCCYSQIVFQKRIATTTIYDMMPKSIIQCSDSGFLIGGTGYFNGSYLTKTNASGAVDWITTIAASPSGNSSLLQAGELSSGGFYAFGHNTDTLPSLTGFYLAVLDNSGNFVWSKIYTHSRIEHPYSRIIQTEDGGFVISQSFTSGMGILRLDPSGNTIWNTTYTVDTLGNTFNPSLDFIVDANGNMVIAGSSDSSLCILKIDSSGQVLWSRVLSNGTSNFFPEGMTRSSDGDYVIVGTCDTLPFAVKLDSLGNLTWFHTYDFAGYHYGITQGLNGNLRIVGLYTPGANTLEELDSAGNVIFGMTTFSLYHHSSFICATNDGAFAIADATYNPLTLHTDLLLLKSDINDSIRCDYANFSFGFDTTTAQPMLTNLPIYQVADVSTSSTITYFIQHPIATVDTLSCTSGVTVQAQPIQPHILTVFPSPICQGQNLSLMINGLEHAASVLIYDSSGKLVGSEFEQFQNSVACAFTLSTSNLNPGIYLICVTDREGNILANTHFVVL